MFCVSIITLFATVIVLGIVYFVPTVNQMLNKFAFTTRRRFFVVCGLFYVTAVFLYSKITKDYLLFRVGSIQFHNEYSTFIWGAIYFLILYVSIFEEFHLNGWIVSKGKESSRINEKQLLSIIIDVSKAVISNENTKEAIFWQVFAELNYFQEDSITLYYGEVFPKNEIKQFCAIRYYCREGRIDDFVDSVIQIIDLIDD